MEKKTKIAKKKVVKEAEPVAVTPAPVAVEAPKKPVVAPKKDKSNPLTYLLLFKVEGHESYRMQPYRTKEDLDIYLSKAVPKFPPMLEKKWFIFDRINGTITLEN